MTTEQAQLPNARDEANAKATTVRNIAFGMDVEAFLKTAMGQYLVKRSEEERAAALDELMTANPTDSAAIADIQLRARVADSFQSWLAQAITDGHNAQAELHEMDHQ